MLPLPQQGDRIEIETHRKDESAHYWATLYESTDEGFVIGLPEAGGETVALRPEERVTVKYHVGPGGYEFTSFVLAAQARPFPLLYLLKPEPHDVKRRQLRQYVRVDTNLPVQIVRQDDSSDEAFAGMINNISGGGMVVSSMVEFRKAEILRFRFSLPEEDSVLDGIVGEVIQVRPGGDRGTDLIVQYQGIDERSRDLIARYVLDIQIKLRRRAKVAAMKAEETKEAKEEKEKTP